MTAHPFPASAGAAFAALASSRDARTVVVSRPTDLGAGHEQALHEGLASGERWAVFAGPGGGATLNPVLARYGIRLGASPLWSIDTADALVADRRVTGVGVDGSVAGLRFLGQDVLVVEGGAACVQVGTQPVVGRVGVGSAGGTLVVVGTASLLDEQWLAAADNARLVAWILTGEEPGDAVAERVRSFRGATAPDHTPPRLVVAADPFHLPDIEGIGLTDPAFVRAAGHGARLLPANVHDALVDFVDEGHASGALLLRGLPVGDLPATPDRPTAAVAKDRVSEFVLLTVARRLGQPVGYLPEHGGDLIQNIVPTRGNEDRQVSTSSGAQLLFHTEAAFHRHRPRYLCLYCLRGDPHGVARTTLASITEVVAALPLGVRRTLFEPRFRTAADESYVGRRPTLLGPPMSVLSGEWDDPHLVFDADLMVGTDVGAEGALRALAEVAGDHHTGVVLEAGDLLVVDNRVAVHGRTPFRARFDGTDRWLQRTFVVADLAASAGERDGRIIATRFAS